MRAVPKRNRRQWGWVELDKSTSPQTWKGRWLDWTQARIDANGRTRPKQRSVVLGYKTKAELPTKGAAQAKWDSIREAMMNPKEEETAPAWTFSEFVWKRYVPDQSALRSWRPATHEKFRFLMSKAEPVFGARSLGEITLASMQNLLVKLAKNECRDTVKGMRTYLRAICREAKQQGIVTLDPAHKLVLPQTRKPNRPFLTIDQICLIEPRLEPRDQIILRLMTRCGLRPGEVFGLTPGDVEADRTVHIRQTFSRGRLGFTKTEGSEGKVAVPDSLYVELVEICRFALANGLPWLFPASRKRGGKLNPISSANWLKRVLKPACEQLGIEVDLRMFRRGFATVASDGGGSLKDIQKQLRHGSITTTANIYVQPV